LPPVQSAHFGLNLRVGTAMAFRPVTGNCGDSCEHPSITLNVDDNSCFITLDLSHFPSDDRVEFSIELQYSDPSIPDPFHLKFTVTTDSDGSGSVMIAQSTGFGDVTIFVRARSKRADYSTDRIWLVPNSCVH